MGDRLIDLRGYGTVEKWVLTNPDISIGAKGLYALICSYAGGKDNAYPSIGLMCSQLSVSKNTLNKYLKELKDNNCIDIEQVREGGKFSHNIYKLLPCTVYQNLVSHNSVSQKTVPQELDTKNNSSKNNSLKNNNIISMCDKVSKKDVDTVIERYKTIEGVEQHRAYEEVRRKAIRDKIKKYGLDTVMEVLDKVEQSTFLTTGKNKKTNIDFIFKQKNKKSGVSNFIEILENKYKDKNTTSKQPKTNYNTNNMLG